MAVSGAGTINIDWNSDSVIDVVDVVGAAGIYTQTPAVPFLDGDHTVTATFIPSGGGFTGDSASITVDTVAPLAPPAPDLQPGSDTGDLDDDDLTGATTLVFDVASTDQYFRFQRSGLQISNDYEGGLTYTAVGEPAGVWDYTLTAVDAAGNESLASEELEVTVNTVIPGAPAAPDLLSSSDTGVSSTDEITKAQSPQFDVTGAGPFFRFYRDGVQISGDVVVDPLDPLPTIFTAVDEPTGIHIYTVTSVDESGNESAQSPGLTVEIDRAAPTVSAQNIDMTIIVDGGVAGQVDLGDIILLTWDNSSLGDSNSDVPVITADLSSFGGSALAPMFDDGTNGDAVAGDDVWSVLHTVVQGLGGGLPAGVTASDTAGNLGSARLSGGIPNVNDPVVSYSAPGAFIRIYDILGGQILQPSDDVDINVKPDGTASIKLMGRSPMASVGILIFGVPRVDSIIDARKGPVGNLAFIASSAPIGKIKLKSGLMGYNLNGAVFDDFILPADIDGDGNLSDLTALYSGGYIRIAQLAAGTDADIVIGGTDANGLAFNKFQIKSGGFHGDFTAMGSGGKLTLAGDFGSSIRIEGSLSSYQQKGGDFGGLMSVLTNLSKFTLKGGKSGGGRLLAGSNLSVGGLLGKGRADGYQTNNGATPFGIQVGTLGSLKLGQVKLGDDSLPFVDGDFRVTHIV